jgi:hypothetical protein
MAGKDLSGHAGCGQRVLFSGLDCLPGQLDLFEVDGCGQVDELNPPPPVDPEILMRQERTCRGCKCQKDLGLVVCWSCWSRESPAEGVEPLKYSGLSIMQWLRQIEAAAEGGAA